MSIRWGQLIGVECKLITIGLERTALGAGVEITCTMRRANQCTLSLLAALAAAAVTSAAMGEDGCPMVHSGVLLNLIVMHVG